MNIKTIITIAKKEFSGFINTPLSFIICVPFLLISVFLFMRTSLVIGEASLRPYFDLLPWFLILIAPALSMKLITDEKKAGTLELLFAHPITETELILGKFFGTLAFFILILASTMMLPVSLLIYANPDPGIIVTQYLGAIFVGSTFISIGLFASSVISNAIGSFLFSASISFIFMLIGFDLVTLMLPYPFSRIVSEIAVMTHMGNIAKGLLDIRDIFYFVTVGGIFLTSAIMKISENKLAENINEKRKLKLALFLIIGIGVLANTFMLYYPFRFDLTQQKLFTLSSGSKQTLSKLPDILTISLYASRNLPAQMQLTLKETEDVLEDYKKFGKNIIVKKYYPDSDREAANQAQSAGIQEVTFNKIGSGKFEVQSGFLGVSLRYGEKTEVIPFIQNTSDLEYQLTKRIRKLTGDKERNIGIFTVGRGSYQLLSDLLGTEYKVKQIDMSTLLNETKNKTFDVLIISDDATSESTASSVLKNYLKDSGKMILLADGVAINTQYLAGENSKNSWVNLLDDWGVKIKNDLVYDQQLNEILTFGGKGNAQYAAPYPFWIRAIPEDKSFTPADGIKSLTMGWPSSLELNQKDGITAKKIIVSGRTAGKLESNFNISPLNSDSLPAPLNDKILLGVYLEKENAKLTVIGNSRIIGDQFLEGFGENASFITGLVDYMTADKDLVSIPKKVTARAVFHFNSPYELIIYQYGNILIPPLVVIIFAVSWLAKRRKLTQRTYYEE